MFFRPSRVRALIRAVGVSAGQHGAALHHLRAGRPLEATALIQRSLAGAGPSSRPWGLPSSGTRPWTVGATTRVPFDAACSSPRRGVGGASPSPEGTVTRGTWRGAAGTLGYRVFVPARRRSPAPLMVMLHGGTQDAETFAAATGMDEIAEREGFVVVYPEQSRSANPLGYWNWFRPGDQHRDAGEPSSIAGITRAVAAEHDVEPGAVAVMGFSAGAAMAAVLAATYPDLYTAAGVHSGLAAGAARDVRSAFAAMRGTPAVASEAPPLRVPLLVFHGERDDTVAVGNATRVVESAVGNRPASSTTTGREPGGRHWTRHQWFAPDGGLLVESWTVHGAGHAWSGGSAGGSYTDPTGPDASTAMVEFCGFLRPDETSTA